MHFFTRHLKEYFLGPDSLKVIRVSGMHGLLIVLLLLMHEQSFSQIQTGVVPDGTQGETFRINKADTIAQPLTFENWNQFNGPFSTLKIGGGFLYEYGTYVQDEVSKEQVEMTSGFRVRDFRVTLSGRVKSKRFITWRAGIMYDGPSKSWFVRETGVMIGVPELSGNIFVGRTKEGFSMNKVMVGYAGWGLERQMGIDIIPILADGVKWLGYLPKQRILWNLGVFTDWLSYKQSFSTYSWQTAARIGWLPVYSDDGKNIFHVAVNARYGKTTDGEFRAKSRPEAFTAPFFVDTDIFPADHSVHLGGEAYYRTGSWMFGGEYYSHKFSSPETGDPLFHGGEAMVSYIITGESRPYSTVTGIYGFVPVNKPVFKGGPGAWEVILRITNIDLDGGTLTGGKFWRITPMVNWYLSENVRLELAYGYGVLDRFNMKGATQFFQTRIQLSL